MDTHLEAQYEDLNGGYSDFDFELDDTDEDCEDCGEDMDDCEFCACCSDGPGPDNLFDPSDEDD